MTNRCLSLTAVLLLASSVSAGCGARKALAPAMARLPISRPAVQKAKPLVDAHFQGDRSRRITEGHLKKVLAAPVFIEDEARIGVVAVTGVYGPDGAIPVNAVPGALKERLEDTRTFDAVTEVSTSWPVDRGIAGLRELAARYRSEYLLLYRHRFVEDRHTNGWGAAYLTLLGSLFVPSRTLRAAGVLEATLFDVKSGTILFTVFERIERERDSNIWANDRKAQAMKKEMVVKATAALGVQVIEKIDELNQAKQRHLAASNPPASGNHDDFMTRTPHRGGIIAVE